jgi:hypothetical protein
MKAALENFSGRGTERAFLASWAKCPGDVKRMIVPPSASASVSAFSVTFFASPDGTVERVSMFVEPDGQVRSLKSSPIYRWPQSGTNHRQSVL